MRFSVCLSPRSFIAAILYVGLGSLNSRITRKLQTYRVCKKGPLLQLARSALAYYYGVHSSVFLKFSRSTL
jgi:hypothetical protein